MFLHLPRTCGVAIATLVLLIGAVAVSKDRENLPDLEKGFASPPDAARPWVYWFIMDGHLNRAGITADLEAMQAAGIGGCVFMEVNVGIPRGPVEFMSGPWQALFQHAVHETQRLGLELAVASGPGWAGSGGPWIKPEQSMQHLVASAYQIAGPAKLDTVLPRPEPRPPYFGKSSLSAEMARQREAFYADVAVLAFPSVGDNARLADIDEKALYVREPYSSKPGVKAYLPPPTTAAKPSPGAAIALDQVVDLTDRLRPDGRLTLDVPPGQWTILRFGRRTTGANTRPAPRSGYGFECDKFSAAALDAHFDAYLGKLLQTVGPRPSDHTSGWTFLHLDSWEMGAQNWTAGFRQQFQRRRGYDPLPYLPAMTGRVVQTAEISERFLWDLRLTAQELVIENYAQHLKQLGRRHGLKLSIEPYDMNPTSDMTLGGVADVPMGEFWAQGYGFDTTYSCFEATSIAHTLGRPIVAAEAFTADKREAWRLYPTVMKNQSDWALCTGINRFVFHRFAHQPWPDRRPGMTMGPYGVHWDRTQTWWPLAAAYHRYLARCQFLLRQGATVADLCYLVPEGAPNVFRPPPSALSGALPGALPERRGYNFDACAPETLLAQASVEAGQVVFPGGAAYRLLVLPAFDAMTPALLRKIRQLVEAGATVVGPPPRKSPSLAGYPQCDQEVASLAAELWGPNAAPPVEVVSRKIGRGRVVWGGPLQEKTLYPDYQSTGRLLAEAGLPPDFESTGPLRYTHRRTAEADLYFVANRQAERVEAACTFRIAGRQPELWDPVSGKMRALGEYEQHTGRTNIPLRFQPHQSFFIVFRQAPASATERNRNKNFPTTTPAARIDGPWQVSFDTKLGGPKNLTFPTLQDWSQRPEPAVRYYSGIATYRQTFDLPASLPAGAVLLDLGTVHHMARVRLNGRDLGVLWCAPWRVDISQVVREKENRLEIDVANLWPNRLIGDQRLPPAQRVAQTTWNPYKPDSALLPSGLLGPVTLQSETWPASRQ